MKGERIVYTDVLRIIAIFGVIMIHTTANILTSCSPASNTWQMSNALSAVVRFSVPVFFMVSGVFFLDPEKDISIRKILTKYIPRIVIALVFWGVAYEMYFVMGDWLKTGDFSSQLAIDGIKKVLLGQGHFHLYFLYLILGLYLICPILRVFTKHATRRQTEYFLLLFFLCSGVIPMLIRLTPLSKLASVFNQINIRMVTGYVGYFLAGYYFSTYSLTKKGRGVIYALGAASAVAAAVGTVQLSVSAGTADVLLYEGLSPFMMLFSAAVFLFVKNMRACRDVSERGRRIIARVSKTTFGIYLMHDFFNMLLRYFGINLSNYLPVLSAPVYSAAVFVICMVITGLLLKIPVVNKYIL